MAMASASCASGDSAPSDMPAESNRDRISDAGCTCVNGIGMKSGRKRNKSRSVEAGRPSTWSAYTW